MLGLGALAYASLVEPRRLQIVRLELTLPRLAPSLDGYRIVQISDLHYDQHWSVKRLHSVIRLVDAQAPDIVAITGDFVTDTAEPFMLELSTALRELSAVDGVVAVLGNHDEQSEPEAIRSALRESGIIELNNTVHTVRRGEGMLHFAGVGSVWEEQDHLDLVLRQLPPEGAAVLLVHEPDFADRSSATGRFDLELSGHSHGGQVRLPLIGPPHLTHLGEKYVMGLYQVGGMLHYTTRGVGMLPPRVRFLCRPEVTVITLRSGSG